MAAWINDLLREWRARAEAPPPHDDAAPLDATSAHALDLLRLHVARSGVQLKLSEAKPPPAPVAHLKAVDDAIKAVDDAEPAAAPGTGFARFGRRSVLMSAEGAAERFARLPDEAVRTPAEMRQAANAFRAAAYSEVETLRADVARLKEALADVARLKEALADITIENRHLKRLIEGGSNTETEVRIRSGDR